MHPSSRFSKLETAIVGAGENGCADPTEQPARPNISISAEK
jgi:hypothetical protein